MFGCLFLYLFYSLDVEGFELEILKTIPFDKLDISVLAVGFVHGQSQDEYKTFMESKGYVVNATVIETNTAINLFAHDYIFVKKTLLV